MDRTANGKAPEPLMNRRKLLKYGVAGTVAAVTGIDARRGLGEIEQPSKSPALAKVTSKPDIHRIESMTSFISGVPPEKGGPEIYPGQFECPPVKHQVFRDEGMVIERDIAVKMRDGVEIYIDLYRPEGEEKTSVIIGWSPYGKFISAMISYKRGNIKYDPKQVSKYSIYEFSRSRQLVPSWSRHYCGG